MSRRKSRRARPRAFGAVGGPREPGDGPEQGTAVRPWGAPQPIVRLEALRILVPLFILGFMSTRLVHADHWVGDAGFRVPDTGGDWRQPIYLPALPGGAAWLLAAVMVGSGLSLAAGFFTRYAAELFALTLAWVALADRLAAFTVSKLGLVLVVALLLSPCGARHGIDAWLERRRRGGVEPQVTHAPGPVLRFFQLTLVVMYCSSGVCKARNDWLTTPKLLWTHLHGSYQTTFTQLVANLSPAWSWDVLQAMTLLFELFAPLWFGLARTRPWALAWGLAMHAMIGLMFGPVIWFSLLMSSLLVACFGPVGWLERSVGRLP